MGTGSSHSQYGDHYPLVDPSDDIQYLIADAIVSWDSPAWEYDLPIRITYLNRSSNDITLKTASGATLFDSRTAEHTSDSSEWGGRFTVYAWDADGIHIECVINNSVSCADPLTPQQAVLDLRTVFLVPKRVRTVNGQAGSIVLKAGTNCLLESSGFHAGSRCGGSVTLGAVAGAGSGKAEAPCTQGTAFGVKTVNGIAPDENGTIFLNTQNGPQLSMMCHGLRLANTNTPCCTCDDMRSLAEYLNRVAGEYRILGGKAQWIRDLHAKQLEAWNSTPPCASAEAVQPQLAAGDCPYVDLRIQVTNLRDVCADITLTGHFTPAMELLASVKSADTLISDAPILLWVNGTPMTGEADKIRHTLAETHTDSQPIVWQSVQGGETVVFHARYRIQGVPAVQTYTVSYDIDTLQAVYTDGVTVHSPSPFLSGSSHVESQLDCASTLQDTMENPALAETVRDEIYEIKRTNWPCPEE